MVADLARNHIFARQALYQSNALVQTFVLALAMYFLRFVALDFTMTSWHEAAALNVPLALCALNTAWSSRSSVPLDQCALFPVDRHQLVYAPLGTIA